MVTFTTSIVVAELELKEVAASHSQWKTEWRIEFSHHPILSHKNARVYVVKFLELGSGHQASVTKQHSMQHDWPKNATIPAIAVKGSTV